MFIVERVSDHGYISNGHRFGRRATTVSTTADPGAVTELRHAAKAEIGIGSSDWIEVRKV